MSLHIYTDKKYIPSDLQFIDNNNLFFKQTTLINTPECKKVLSTIDKATYLDENNFLPRDAEVGPLNKSCLSTGTKTLLNILNNPNKCFDVTECESNALELMCELAEGHVYWHPPCLFITGSKPCDIILNNKKQFTRLRHFLTIAMRKR